MIHDSSRRLGWLFSLHRFAGIVRSLIAAAALFGPIAAGSAADQPAPEPLPLTANQVIEHLNQTVSWLRRVEAAEQVPGLADELVIRDRLHQSAVSTVQLAFEFGRAAATVLSANELSAKDESGGTSANQPSATDTSANNTAQTNTTTANTADPSQPNTQSSSDEADPARLERAAARINTRIADLQTQINALDVQIARATAKRRAALVDQRGRAVAAQSLAREVLETIKDFQRFAALSAANGANGKGLLAQINDLQRTVPETRRSTNTRSSSSPTANGTNDSGSNKPAQTASTTTATSAGAAPGTAASSFQPESAGLIALLTQWFSVRSSLRELEDTLSETDDLSGQLGTLRSALGGESKKLVRANLAVTASGDTGQIAASRDQLEAATARFKQLSTLIVPLGEQDMMLDTSRATLSEWLNAVRARSSTLLRFLALKAGVVLASIGLIAAISHIWRRATFRYLHDVRRRRQFLALRRVAVGIALTVVIVFGLVSEVGSMATYIGFLTAGLAVALQNLILAVVAYFFLIGRYGVRVGDRITLAGVTGRVVDIGLVRIYLMELSGPDLHSTGRIVVLSNAVLFQPAAMFKQIPGADYLWHTLSMTLAPNVGVQAAQARLKSAADAVYKKYRASIERQHAAVQHVVDFDTPMPETEVNVRFTESGLEFSVRYPVEAEHAAMIDQDMIEALRSAAAQDPALALGSTPATPTLKSSST